MSEGTGPHVIQLEANRILRVQVKDSCSLVPKVPAWVKLAATDGSSGDIVWDDDAHVLLKRTPLGGFEVGGVARGEYVLGVGRGKGNPPEITSPITLGQGLNEASFQLGEFPMERFLVVRCLREDGTPVTVDRIEPSHASGFRWHGIQRTRGTYWMPRGEVFVDRQGNAIDEVELTGVSRIYGAASVHVRRDQAEATMEFQRACSLDIQVRGDLSLGYSVEAISTTDATFRGWQPTVDGVRGGKPVGEDGTAVLDGLQPGTYEVRLLLTGHVQRMASGMSHSRRATKMTVTVDRRDQPLEIAAPNAQTVTVYVDDSEPGAALHLTSTSTWESANGITARVGEDGVARFRNVFDGEYILSMFGSAQRSMRITVPTGDVRFVNR
ncbi:hypothetical protein Poly30_03580 [Planctomycetes bacterium Poly30]|uniref:Uncharacterized protein n=1 Tax=Saltatorellus ferox TaxID=2528018 RepID=A0A518EL99_9BACT|nr:hypothetical protein Poly30_03580 [Planctomycetes bacterium Poly30]